MASQCPTQGARPAGLWIACPGQASCPLEPLASPCTSSGFASLMWSKKLALEPHGQAFGKKRCISLRALWHGVWPDDHPLAGQLLAGGWFAVVYINRGDLDWIVGHFKLSHASSRSPCALCKCTNMGPEDPVPWTDSNDSPAWEPTIWKDEDPLPKCIHDNKCAITTPNPDQYLLRVSLEICNPNSHIAPQICNPNSHSAPQICNPNSYSEAWFAP